MAKCHTERIHLMSRQSYQIIDLLTWKTRNRPKDDPETTQKSKDLIKTTANAGYLAFLFFVGADKSRYGREKSSVQVSEMYPG